MKRITVNSSVLQSIKYRRKSRSLAVTFTDGSRYRYLHVPQKVYEAMLRSEEEGSYGRFFNEQIKPEYICIYEGQE